MRKRIKNGRLADTLAILPTLDRAALLDYWRGIYDASPPLHMSTKLMLRVLAYKLQEREHGGLKPAVRRFLEKAADATDEQPAAAMCITKPGTRLIREWRGVVYEVIIEPDGVLLNGERLKSLSEAAYRITGAKWSGPRFFGLVKGGRHGGRKTA